MLTKVFNKNNFVYKIGCVLVGFLKFLRRDKKKDELASLDLPPAPPTTKDDLRDLDLPPMLPPHPTKKDDLKGLDLPPVPPTKKEDFGAAVKKSR